MTTLTPLNTVGAFDAETLERLAPYWITSAEEFVTATQSSNGQFGSGLMALTQVLDKSEETVRTLQKEARKAMPADTSFDVGPPPTLGTGAIFDDMDLPEAESFDLPLELPEEVDLRGDMPPPDQQGQRNTCVAFALIALYQQATGDYSDLSEQFLYWACKSKDGIPHIAGTRPDTALKVFKDMGVCSEQLWPYNAQPGNDEGQGPPPPEAKIEAEQRRIRSYGTLSAKNVRQIKARLAEGSTILIGLPIREHWTNSWQSRRIGRVRKALPGESSLGGHAMAVFGYRDDDEAPGGGYFLVRNSWGTSWATENPDGPGYCHVPYSLVFESNIVACYIEPLPVAPVPESSPAEADMPVDARLASGPTAAPVAPVAPVESDVAEEMRALYQEARSIRDQMNTLTERLAVLLERSRWLT